MTTELLARPRSFRRTAVSTLTACLLFVGLAVGPGAPAANAYSMTYAGPVSWTQITGLTVYQSSAYYQPWRTIAAPIVTAGRTSSVPAGIAQTITAETYLQKYINGSWQIIGTASTSIVINPGQSAKQIVTGVLGRYPGGFYRAQVVVKWFGQYGQLTGVRNYMPNVPADQVCAITTCKSKYGYVQFW